MAADVGGNIYIQPHDNEDGIVIVHDGAVELYHDNSKALDTTAEGIRVFDSNAANVKLNFMTQVDIVVVFMVSALISDF